MSRRHVSRQKRNEILDYIAYWQQRTDAKLGDMLNQIEISHSKYYNWKKRQHSHTRHNGHLPKNHWLLDWETRAIIDYRLDHLDEGYRRLTFMMLDANIVAVSPSSVYRVLRQHHLLLTAWRHQKAKGSGFSQPSKPHKHWHLDISYINFKGTFVFLAALIDGYSRFIVHFEIKTSFEALDVEIMMERALAKYPGVKPALITDNGPQFIAKDFDLYLDDVGITHRRTRFYYPQSNGKIERFFQTCKNEAVRRQSYLSLDDLKQQIGTYVESYNVARLHSAIGYITPNDMLQGRQAAIFDERQRKLKQAQEIRKQQRNQFIVFSEPTTKGTRSEEQSPDRIPAFSG